MTLEFAGAATRLAAGDIDAEAVALGCASAAVHAVCDIESAGGGFLPDGRPKILFEAHVFGGLTAHRWDGSNPNISAASWDRSLYGASGAHQYDRLHQAIELNRAAALMSASYGMFQIMGTNLRACGFTAIEDFVAAMVESERKQLDAFSGFCRTNHLDVALRSTPPAFATFARGYNGPGYAENAYDVKLAAAYRKWLANPSANSNPAPRTDPVAHYSTLQSGSYGPEVASLQTRLAALGFGVTVDHDFGPETLAAVVAFQKAHGLVADGVAGPNTFAALARVLPPLAA